LKERDSGRDELLRLEAVDAAAVRRQGKREERVRVRQKKRGKGEERAACGVRRAARERALGEMKQAAAETRGPSLAPCP
jgi:hypothetical protein